MEQNSPSNFFDDLTEATSFEVAIDQEKARRAEGQKLDDLIHRVFAQGTQGAELLAIWKESLIMQPTAEDGMDMVAVGIREGQKRLIRGILLSIKRIEEGDK